MGMVKIGLLWLPRRSTPINEHVRADLECRFAERAGKLLMQMSPNNMFVFQLNTSIPV